MVNSVLLTRCEQENYNLMLRLGINNFEYLLCPLLRYHKLLINYKSVLAGYSNIIITSKYAAQVLAEELRNITAHYDLWVVGNKSAMILQQLSNVRIKHIAQNIADLIVHIPQSIYSACVYLSANEISMHLPHLINRNIIYKVSYINKLESEQVNAIKSGLNYVLLYSQNCAQHLLQLFNDYNLLYVLKEAIVVAISFQVASVIPPQQCRAMYYSANADENEMIKLLL